MNKRENLKNLLRPMINEIMSKPEFINEAKVALKDKELETYILDLANTILDAKKTINNWKVILHGYSDELMWVKRNKYGIIIEPYQRKKPGIYVQLINVPHLKLKNLPDKHDEFETKVKYVFTGDMEADVKKYFEIATSIINKYGKY